MTHYIIRHETRYDYEAPVDLGFHVLRLTPRATGRQTLRAYRLTIEPEPTRFERFTDHFDNDTHYVSIIRTHDHFTATVEAEVTIADSKVPLGGAPPSWECIREMMQNDGLPTPPEVAEFVHPSPLAPASDEATAYAASSFAAGRPITEGLRDLTARIHRDFSYTPNQTDVSTRVSEVLSARHGVCQDFAHVMIAGLRGLGLPARYVSGYIRSRSPATAGADALIGAEASHAWVSAWCGDEWGWIEVDPTNDRVVTDQHVVVAYGRDFSDVSPLRGVILGGGNHKLRVSVNVFSPADSRAASA
jgi:transglutaminase-like putative cysteine protease